MNGNNADEIIPGIWLGNYRSATDPKWIAEKGIRSVFNCSKDIPFVDFVKRKYRVPVDDNLEAQEIRNLELWSYEIVYKMTMEYKSGEPMLVHCMAGMQRSAACLAMFLISNRNMRPDEAMRYIKERRPIAFGKSANFAPAIEGFYEAYQKDIAKSFF